MVIKSAHMRCYWKVWTLSAVVAPRTHINWLGGTNKLQLPRVNTTHLIGKTPSNFLRPNYGIC